MKWEFKVLSLTRVDNSFDKVFIIFSTRNELISWVHV
jgi:hypothetical protein